MRISLQLVRRVEHLVSLYESLERPDHEDREDLAYWEGFLKACDILRDRTTEREVAQKIDDEILLFEPGD